MKTSDFFAARSVFSLDEATRALEPSRGRAGAIHRLKHHLSTGRLRLVWRGVYAVVPSGVPAKRFQPDPFLVAAAARPDAVFSHHSALELLGSAHSAWSVCSAYTSGRRHEVGLDRGTIKFRQHPAPMQGDVRFATRQVERRGQLLAVTGPERTLVEGFRQPVLTGGLEELIESARSFPVIDLSLLEAVLDRYDMARLWAAVGWFLEFERETFAVPEQYLVRLERHRPRSPQYLSRGERGGSLVRRWNLIVRTALARRRGMDEP